MPIITDIFGLLRFEEGDRLIVYDDFNGKAIGPGSHVFGHPTIGVGIRLDGNAGITQDESSMLVKDRVQTLELSLARYPWYLALDPVRQWALVSMAHAMGVGGVTSYYKMIEALSAVPPDFAAAKAAVLDSTWAKREEPDRAMR